MRATASKYFRITTIPKSKSPTQYSVPLVQITNKMSGASKEMFTAAMTQSPPLVRPALELVSNCCSALQTWQAVS
jgi:hypothetical protein